jgi:hypothetical protein
MKVITLATFITVKDFGALHSSWSTVNMKAVISYTVFGNHVPIYTVSYSSGRIFAFVNVFETESKSSNDSFLMHKVSEEPIACSLLIHTDVTEHRGRCFSNK